MLKLNRSFHSLIYTKDYIEWRKAYTFMLESYYFNLMNTIKLLRKFLGKLFDIPFHFISQNFYAEEGKERTCCYYANKIAFDRISLHLNEF